MSDKLEADKRERKKKLKLFTRWQNMAEMSYSN